MKKYRVFILSAVITILMLGVLYGLYHYFFGVKESYTISSEVSFYDKNGMIEGYAINFEDCKNEEGNFELKIKVGSRETRKIGFAISALVNYEQQSFYTDGSDEKSISAVVFAEGDSKETTITLDKNLFKRTQNQLILNVRQDITQYSDNNDLVRDSNTLNFTFYVANESGEKQSVTPEQPLTNMIEIPIDEQEQDSVIELKKDNHKDDPLIKVKKNEEIKMNLSVGGRNTEEYIVWACLDSQQVKLNGNLYNSMKITKGMVGNAAISIQQNMPPGKYELEVYCVPSPYEENSSVIKEIISAKRYTVEVE